MRDDKKHPRIPDITEFTQPSGDASPDLTPEQIGQEDAAQLAKTGVLLHDTQRSATMVVRDHHTIYLQNNTKGFEILPLSTALARYDWLREKYLFKAISADYDEAVARCAAQEKPLGFFIHVQEGEKVALPCQAAMYMASEKLAQMVHNIVILEEGAQLQLITGCATRHNVHSGLHFAVEEYFIGKNAILTSTMVHSWGSEVLVYPRAGTIVEEGGRYESNFISLRAPKHVMTNPQTFLNGKGASAKYLTIVLDSPGSVLETGGKVYLNAEDTSAELVHRGVCTGGTMHQGGLLIGNAPCKAHVDCAGMLLDTTGQGRIESVPGLQSHHPDARMSHEASIGKLAPEQIEYLMSRGMEEQEAISLLIRGFLGVDIVGLGTELDAEIAKIAALAGHGEK